MKSGIESSFMVKTHLKIDERYSGRVVKAEDGYAEVLLTTSQEMLADEQGLIHGGFTFSAADFAAMLAVNEPTVVLVAANVSFLAPIKLGESALFRANVVQQEGRKSFVAVIGLVGEQEVFKGEFQTYTPAEHILDRK